jgi:hypothetical protein
MQSRTPWVIAGVVVMVTTGLTVWSYFYSPSLTVCDLTVQLDEGLVVVNVPLVPIAKGETPGTQFLLYRRDADGWQTGKGARMPWRNLPNVEAFANDCMLVAGFGYWWGGWQSDARPGRFFVLLLPLWAVALFGFLAYLALRARWVRLRLWMFFVLTPVLAVGLVWLTRRA